jgi:hypothetical protein
MTLVGTVLMVIVTYMIMRRRGRVFLEPEEAVTLAFYAVLALVQRVYAGGVNLNDFVATPLYFAFPVVLGHARGPARGAAAALVGGWTLVVMAVGLTPEATTSLAGLPGQYLVLVALMGLIGAGAGLSFVPKALKPPLCAGYLLLVAAYHPEFLRSLAPFVIQFIAMALAAAGLILNPFRGRAVPTVHYPTSASRRA